MKRIIGYVNTADLNHMREEDVRALTVINIAFGLIRDGEVVWDAKDARDGMVSIRKSNPELKIVLSVGGWGADGFSQAARTKEGRERFAASALAIVKEYGLDGIDIDWEYPGTSLAGIASDRSDKENYTLLLAELRKTLDAYREGMLVTTAVGGDVYFALQTDMKEASRYLDYVQLMTYDLQGGFQKVTGHHAALYHSEGNLFDACVEKAVNGFANAGVPMEKAPDAATGLEWKQRRLEDMAVTMASLKRAGSERGDLSGIGMSRRRFRICLTGRHLSAMRTASHWV